MRTRIGGESIIYRHAHKADPGNDAPWYPGLSEQGVTAARMAGRNFLGEIISRRPGTVFVFSAHSNQERTWSTLKALFEGVREIIAEESPNGVRLVSVPSRGSREHLTPHLLGKNLDRARYFTGESCLVYSPRHQNGFDVSEWYKPDGSPIDYHTRLNDLVGRNQDEFVRRWIANQGELDGLKSPNPTKVSEGQIAGIEELRKICTRKLPGRPIVPIGVGHSYNLDSYAVALSNNGQVTEQAFSELGGRMIQEMEPVRVLRSDQSNPNGPLVMSYGTRPARPI